MTNLLELRFAIVVILVMNIPIFEYSNICYQTYEYSNIFVYQNYNIRIRISNIRTKLFEYSNIFEYSLITVVVVVVVVVNVVVVALLVVIGHIIFSCGQ